jgi:hypothetical protein
MTATAGRPPRARKAQEQADEAERAHAYLLDKLAKASDGRKQTAPSPKKMSTAPSVPHEPISQP